MGLCLWLCLVIIIIWCCEESDSFNHYFYKNNLISVLQVNGFATVVTMFTDINIYMKLLYHHLFFVNVPN